MIFLFRKARPSEEPRRPEECCPVCGMSFAMYPADEGSRARIIEAHIQAFHPAYAVRKKEVEF